MLNLKDSFLPEMEEKIFKPITSFGLIVSKSSGSCNKYALYIFGYVLLIRERGNSICTYSSRMFLINDKTKLGNSSNFHWKKTKFLINAFSRKEFNNMENRIFTAINTIL